MRFSEVIGQRELKRHLVRGVDTGRSKYMIRQSGHFDYDGNLDEFYDYEGYALQRMNEEGGMFTDRGYIAYKGYISMEEVMNGSQSSHMEMGGMM